MRDWLETKASLTARLVAHSESFRVRRLHQNYYAPMTTGMALLTLQDA